MYYFFGVLCLALCGIGYSNKCNPGCKDNSCYSNGTCSNGCNSGYSDHYCTWCDNGYYNIRGLCCPKNCVSCSSASECSECKDGWYGKTCSKICPTNCNTRKCHIKYGSCCGKGDTGPWCSLLCLPTCNSPNCPINDGSCTCKQGYTGAMCDQCLYGSFYINRQCHKCPNNCKTCFSQTACLECKHGWYGHACDTCKQGYECVRCLSGWYGNNDQCEQCPDHCNECSSHNMCYSCAAGYHGDTCQLNCSRGCQGATHACDESTGECNNGCIDGRWGNSCDKDCPSSCTSCTSNTVCNHCVDGYYGTGCQLNCSQGCSGECEKHTGDCRICKTGYSGNKCCVQNNNCQFCSSNTKCSKCVQRFYGSACKTKCPKNCDGVCHTLTGNCPSCKKGYYGSKCDRICLPNCAECDIEGTCIVCKNGFHGSSCNLPCKVNCKTCKGLYTCEKCKDGFYGPDCSKTCPSNCVACSSATECTVCKDGFTSSKCERKCSTRCQSCLISEARVCKKCIRGRFGTDWFNNLSSCYSQCSENCLPDFCDERSGRCISGCVNGYSGDTCECPENCLNACYAVDRNCHGCIDSFSGDKCSCITDTQRCSNLVCSSCSNNTWYRTDIGCCKCSGTCRNSQCINETMCTNGCTDGYYEAQCNERCSKRDLACITCTSEGCSRCVFGFYPSNSSGQCIQCSEQCIHENCSATDGSCLEGCQKGFWGKRCDVRCDVHCKICDRETGVCNSCAHERFTRNCSRFCRESCIRTDFSEVTCDIDNGQCELGCINHTIHGQFCDLPCNKTCTERTCNWKTGKCYKGCIRTHFGEWCERRCSDTCIGNVADRNCDQAHGSCNFGCIKGYYDSRCDRECSRNCVNEICVRSNGTCTFGCFSGYDGHNCTQALKNSQSSNTGNNEQIVHGVVGGVVVVVVVVVVLFLVAVIRQKRRKKGQKNGLDTNKEEETILIDIEGITKNTSVFVDETSFTSEFDSTADRRLMDYNTSLPVRVVLPVTTPVPEGQELFVNPYNRRLTVIVQQLLNKLNPRRVLRIKETTGEDRFNNPDYINWLRSTLAFIYMKDCLEESTDDNQSDLFHKQLPKLFENTSHACKGNVSTGSHIGRQDLPDKLLGIRNSLLHSGEFKVSEADAMNHLQTMLSFMQGMTCSADSEKDTLKAAIEKVQQLEANQIEISVHKDLEIRALQERLVAADRDVKALEDLKKMEQDRKSTEVKQYAENLQELKAANAKFHAFLGRNDLDLDVSKLSSRIGDIYQTVAQHETRICTVEDQIQERSDLGLDVPNRIGDIDQTVAQHETGISTVEDKMQPSTKVHTSSDVDFEEKCKELQQHLLHTYGRRKFWENPVSSEEVFLSQMYVQPSVKFIREINDQGMLAEVKEQASSKLTYEGIFLSKSGLCENIYITGDAGKGKTTFCNQLFLHWCNAVKKIQNKGVSPEEQALLASFRFLFHINLRYAETTYHVEDMIHDQLLFNTRVPINVSDILKTERCLIVMDGLDEWLCPDNVKKCPDINQHIPGRSTSNKKCVFLTTTRSWKYDAISLNNKDVEKHVELTGIGEVSSKDLAQKILDNLDQNSKMKKDAFDFNRIVKQKELNEFLTVPVLLIRLITLWHTGKDYGKSQLHLYCSMLDLMFERSEKNLPEKIPECSSIAVAALKPLPDCFSTNYNCQKFAELLHCLAKLAYKALFNKQREEALVFKSSRLEIFGISPSNIKLCLHCGILSQCKDYGNRTGKYKKFSFLHKKVQEFLAALYLVTNDKVEDILKEVKQLCISVETMLEMNQVWLFVAGMNRDMTRQLLEHLGHVVFGDERVNTYRQTVDSGYDSLILTIQRCVSDCASEGINNGHHYENVCLQDFYVYSYNVRDVERVLFCSDMSKVKSVYITTEDIDATKVEAITCQFLQCRSIQTLHVYDPWFSSLIPDSTVTDLVDNNWASLTVLYLHTRITATDKLVTAICSSISKSLMALELSSVTLTHKHLEQILASLSQSLVLRQLELCLLYCTDHKNKCRDKIECSDMTRLQKLTLKHSTIYVVNLPSLPNVLERVHLSNFKLTHKHLEQLLHGLSQSPVIRQLNLRELECTDHDKECRAKIDCSAMTQLQELTLSSIFGCSWYVVNLPSLPHYVEKVELTLVTLSVTSLRDFARGLSQTKRKVTVKLKRVTLTSKARVIRAFFMRKVTQLSEMSYWKGFTHSHLGLELTKVREFMREESEDLERFLKNCPGLESTEVREFMREESEDLERFLKNCPGLESTEVRELMREESGDLKDFLQNCLRLELPEVRELMREESGYLKGLLQNCPGLKLTEMRQIMRYVSEDLKYFLQNCPGLEYTEMRQIMREVGEDLKGFLQNCPGLELTKCEYNNLDNIWSIKFHTSSQ